MSRAEYVLTMRDTSGVSMTIKADSIEEAKQAARDWAREGDYFSGEVGESTIWVDVGIEWTDEDGDECEDEVRNISVDPDAPSCEAGKEHDWQSPYDLLGGLKENPGVWGHGGGVICREVCSHCGVYRVTDSWAQRPDNGVQGLDSVKYEDSDDASLAWVAEVES